MKSQDLSVVRQISFSIGKSHRALRDQQPPKTSQSRTHRLSNATPTIFVGPEYPPTGNALHSSIADVSLGLHRILFLGGTNANGEASISPSLRYITCKDNSRPVLKDKLEVPDVTHEQVRLSFSVIPSDNCTLRCSTCCDEGHSTFMWTYLTSQQKSSSHISTTSSQSRPIRK